MNMVNDIKMIFEQHGGIMQTSQLEENGIYYKKLQQLIEEGEVEQVRRGYYQYIDENAFSEVTVIKKLFPDGILCMESALEYYDYTECTPSAWHIAVDANSTRTRFYLDYPVVKPHFIQRNRLDIGVTEVEIDGVKISIYDRDKTMCDCLYHRNKMDAEVFNNAVRCYLKDEKKNLARLAEYARALKVEKKVREVLGAWL